MRQLGRLRVSRRPPSSRIGSPAWLRILVTACGLIGLALPAAAREVTIRGLPEKGFGRIELSFDRATKVQLRNSGSILVIGFHEPTRVKVEKLPAELPAYLSASRRDPDGTGLRLALTRPFRANLLEAGERVYVDLLPERWSGLPPSLPPEVVAELAERARAAEEKLREAAARRAGAARPVHLRLAETPDHTRIVLEPPAGTPLRFTETPGASELRIEGNLTLDLGGNRPRSAGGVAEFTSVQDEGGLTIRVAAASGRTLRSFVDEGSAVIELLSAAPPRPPTPSPAMEAPATRPEPAPQRRAETSQPLPSTPPEEQRRQPAAADPFVLPPNPVSSPAVATLPVRATIEGSAEGRVLLLPFRRPTAAAAFERGGRATLVFQTTEQVVLDGVDAAARASLGLRLARQEGGFAILTLEAPTGQGLRLAPEGTGWRLAPGAAATPPDDVLVARSGGADGRGEVTVGLAGSAVHWLLGPDDVPLAVVTTAARQGLANPRRFVEFDLLPTIQGLVVQPTADQVQVALGRGGVVVTRHAGLALSAVGQAGAVAEDHPFVIRSEEWDADTSGDVMARYRALVAAAAGAPRAGKASLRFGLARLLLANGLAHEAASVLAAASADDPQFARRRETLLLSGIAAVRARRPKDARRFLSDEALGSDPEASLWRAALDAEAQDWPRAMDGLISGAPVLARYPDELVGWFKLLSVRTAVALGRVKSAEEALAAIDRLPLGTLDRESVDLARATVDEAAGRTMPALAAYERLAGDDSWPIAAAASLREVRLARKTARMPATEAISRLEALAVTWRGDEVELGTLGQLVRLYGEAKRWRPMFESARLAHMRFPAREETRRIYDEAAAWFEALFSGREGEAIDAVDFLALYYDFKEFAPAGRRGDEIVRRIADRLVEIDLLDQAATLLQHQVDHRLTGLARVTIATRLAALRLMSGKPGLAISALNGSRMSELPPPLRRLRRIIEAQAQADLSRVDLALEAVEGEEGADFDRLRATIHFGARRWREAGEAFEGLLGTRWRDPGALTDEERQDVLRATIAAILAQEWMVLDRIRSKFAAKMADSPDTKLFEALLRPRAAQSPEFRAALRQASRSDSMRRFLADWSHVSELPPEPPPPPSKAAEAGATAAPG
jgi:hypothetical protein